MKPPLKIVILLLVIILLVLGGVWLYQETRDPAPPILRSLYPHFQIKKLSDDPHHYTFGNYDGFEFDFYAKEVTIGSAPFFLTVENKSNQRSIYSFYAIGLASEPVAQIEWGLPVTSSVDAFENNLSYDDITGDGTKEAFVRTRSEEGHLSYAIFKEWNRSLRPISLEANYSGWINIKYQRREGDAIYFVTATSDDPSNETYDEEHEQKFYLAGDLIVTEAEVMRATQASSFNQDIYEATQDSKWRALAEAFRDSCETLPGSVLNAQGLPFREMIEALEPVKTDLDGSKVYIVPCMLHAYQTSQMATYYDGEKYLPIFINQMDYDGNPTDGGYSTVELAYDSSRDLFLSYAKGRGQGDCGTGTEYKLEGKELVIQKFEGDKECDGEQKMELIYERR